MIVTPSSIDSREYYRATRTGISGDRRYQNGPMHTFELVDNPWLEENIINGHGPLGALYPRFVYKEVGVDVAAGLFACSPDDSPVYSCVTHIA